MRLQADIHGSVNFYNEIDPYAAQWLRNLIEAGAIAPGVVDERDIRDIRPDELMGFTQCHFFAGIGVWSYALRLAGWDDTRPCWTASCPCQPFSAAGRGNGFADERHLWPAFFHLVSQCKPSDIFGEQVASKAVEPWIELVHADLEGLGYAFGCAAFPSAGVGAPHVRDRAYWVGVALGDAEFAGLEGLWRDGRYWCEPGRQYTNQDGSVGQAGALVQLANTDGVRQARIGGSGQKGIAEHSAVSVMANTECFERKRGIPEFGLDSGTEECRPSAKLAGHGVFGALDAPGRSVHVRGSGIERNSHSGPFNGFWSDVDWLCCRDGRWRPVRPGAFPLVNGSAGNLGRMRADQEAIAALQRKDQGSRIGRLKGYGNAINAIAAAEFIKACG